MIRAHENPLALRAGVLSILVHIVLLAILLLSFNWKAVQPASIAQVELWDSLPVPQPVIEPTPQPPEPPKPEPVIKEEPKPEPPPEPKAEIEIKKKPPVEVKPKEEKPKEKPKAEEKPKPDPALKAKEEEKKRLEQLKKVQQMLAEEDKNMQHEQQKKEAQGPAQANAAQSAASKGEVDKYIGLVSSKIRPYVNKQLCGTGKPELIFEIALLPTGEISGSPKRIQGSGITACDDAVERAIRQANPLPKPSADILSQVRDLILKFRPNDDN